MRRTTENHGRFMQYRMSSLEAGRLYALLEDIVGVMHTGMTPVRKSLRGKGPGQKPSEIS